MAMPRSSALCILLTLAIFQTPASFATSTIVSLNLTESEPHYTCTRLSQWITPAWDLSDCQSAIVKLNRTEVDVHNASSFTFQYRIPEDFMNLMKTPRRYVASKYATAKGKASTTGKRSHLVFY